VFEKGRVAILGHRVIQIRNRAPRKKPNPKNKNLARKEEGGKEISPSKGRGDAREENRRTIRGEGKKTGRGLTRLALGDEKRALETAGIQKEGSHPWQYPAKSTGSDAAKRTRGKRTEVGKENKLRSGQGAG